MSVHVGCDDVMCFLRGKGDYFRLGHGTDDHVRRPKKVAALLGKKVIAIATGSLHCVACTDAGEVFTWGDNDEGQLGDGTTNAIQKPRLVTALQVQWRTRERDRSRASHALKCHARTGHVHTRTHTHGRVQFTNKPCTGCNFTRTPSRGSSLRSFTQLTLSFPRVIDFKFSLQPHQKYYITLYEERGYSQPTQMEDDHTTNSHYLTFL